MWTNSMARGKQPGKQVVSSASLNQQICEDLNWQLARIAAFDEYLRTVQDTVSRLRKGPAEVADPLLADQIYDTVMKQYCSLMSNLSSRPTTPHS
jgi:hypothetical protein